MNIEQEFTLAVGECQQCRHKWDNPVDIRKAIGNNWESFIEWHETEIMLGIQALALCFCGFSNVMLVSLDILMTPKYLKQAYISYIIALRKLNINART